LPKIYWRSEQASKQALDDDFVLQVYVLWAFISKAKAHAVEQQQQQKAQKLRSILMVSSGDFMLIYMLLLFVAVNLSCAKHSHFNE